METLLAVLIILLKIIAVLMPLLLSVAYLTFAERKVIGYMQVRLGPNRVGPKGWLQPIADAVKLMFKEIIIPTRANRFLFILAPILSFGPAIAAWAVWSVRALAPACCRWATSSRTPASGSPPRWPVPSPARWLPACSTLR